jgi:parallel beta-helix repeat protein
MRPATLFAAAAALVALLLAPFAYGSSTYSSTISSDAPSGYWRLGEPAGASSAADATGHGHSGAYVNGVQTGVAGTVVGDTDTAAHFDGSNDYVQADAAVGNFPGTQPFTIEAWVRISTVDSTFRRVLSSELDSPSGRSGWNISYNQTYGFTFSRWVNGAEVGGATYTPIQVGHWYHVVGVYSGSQLSTYVDGSLKRIISDTRAEPTSTQPVSIGRYAGGGLYFAGDMDEVAIYPTALSAARVQAHYLSATSSGGSGTPPPPPSGGGTVGSSLPAPLAASTGTTFYVSPSGSDTNSGTSASPWRTIQRALKSLTAGQTVVVAAGTYGERDYTVNSGTASAPITLKAAAGAKPVITGRLKITNAYFRVRGFKFQGQNSLSTDTLIYVSGATHIEISNNEISHSTQSGIYLSGSSDVQILANWIHDAGTQAGSDHGVYWDSGSGGLIADNLIVNSRAFGVHLYPNADNIIVANNVVVSSGKSGIIVSGTSGSASSGCTIVNNIVAFSGEWGVRSYYPGPVGSNLVEYNIGFSNPLGDFPSGTAVATGLTFQNNVVADPLFVSGTSDMHVQAGSPAIDSGLASFAPTTAYDGAARPQGAGADIGAYER